ncbi:cysteine desulfurase family protein [bacterium]
MKSQIVYADNSATTQIDPIVFKEMEPYFNTHFGNPSSAHSMGSFTKNAIESAREKIAASLKCSAKEIFFTAGGTEADNWALKGIVNSHTPNKNLHLVTTTIEHHAVLKTAQYLESKNVETTYLPVNRDGLIDLDTLKSCIKENTILVSIMFANNETGAVQPIKEIGKILDEINISRKAKNLGKIYFHSDAVQAFGKIDIDLSKLNIDLLAISSHKIHGPKGIGALYIKNGTIIEPLFHGGKHEFAKRAGTENVPGIIGFAKACELAAKNLQKEAKRLENIKLKLHKGIMKNIKASFLNGSLENSLPNVLNIAFNYIEGESIIMMLDAKGIFVSSGSACTSDTLGPSHVLNAMKIDVILAQGSIRFSFGRFNTEEDVDYILEVLPPIIERLRKMSPLYKQ